LSARDADTWLRLKAMESQEDKGDHATKTFDLY
jgi:hypothetical protein